MLRFRRAVQLAMLSVLSTVMSCSSDATPTEIQDLINSIVVSLSLNTLTVGQTVQAGAIAKDASGGSLNGVTIAWTTSNNAVATVSTTGLVTAVAPGTATIGASAVGKSTSVSVTVVPVPVAAVSVALSATTVQVGQAVTATATTRDAASVVLTNRGVTWSSSNPAVATVSGTGAVTTLSAGATAITATSEGINGSATLTVNALTVANVTVTLGSSALRPGGSTTATAVLRDAANNVINGKSVTFSSSNISVATVTAAGVVTAVTAGSAIISATVDGVTGTAGLTVQAPVASVAVAIADNPVTQGRSTTATATTRDAAGNVVTGRVIDWSSSNSAVAIISPTSGAISSVAPGTTTITATSEGVSGTATLTVRVAIGSVTVSIPAPVVRVGLGTQAFATIRDVNGVVLSDRIVAWTSSNTGVATVAQDGGISAVAVGAASITATVEGSSASAGITVLAASGGGGGSPATHLGILQQPGGAASGVTMASPPVVQILDANNQPVAGANNVVAASVATGPGSIIAGGSIAAVNGAALFRDLVVNGAGTYTLTFSAQGLPSVNSASFVVAVAPLITTVAVPSLTATTTIAITPFTPVTAVGGTAPYTFALSGGTLPTGLNFNTSTGQITGTPTVPLAATTFTVTVTDASAVTSAKTFTLTVNPVGPPLSTVQAIANTTGAVNIAVPAFIPVVAAGGATPYAFALSGGTLPAGMNFNTNTGQVSGTPTAVLATTTFTVTVTDALNATSAKTFTLTVNAAAAALTTTQAVPTTIGTVNNAIASFAPVTASGGTAPYAFALTGGTLPAGMNFNTTTGMVSGTPTATLLATNFTVTVTDAANATSSKSFSLTVNSNLNTTLAVAARVGTVNLAIASFTPVTSTGGTAPVTFAISGGTLPTGMGFNTATGQVSGTPTTTLAATNFTVTATDAAGATSSKNFSLTVNVAVSTTQAVPTKVGTVNTAIAGFVPVTAAGGTTPYSYALTGGSLPNGMSFSTNTGQVSGTPTASLASTNFTITVTDAAGATSSKTFNLTVNPALVTTQAVPSTTGSTNTPLSFTPVTVSGGTTPYAFVLTGGALPNGMNFNGTSGLVSGTPTSTLTTTTFTVTVSDAVAATSFKTFDLAVSGPPGNLAGSVTDGANAAVGGGTVEVRTSNGANIVGTATVAGNGTFTVPNLPPTNYLVRLHPPKTFSMGPNEPVDRPVTITSNNTTTQPFKVQPALYFDDFQRYTNVSQLTSLNNSAGNFFDSALNGEISSVANPARIFLDATGGPGGTKSMRYDWPNNGNGGTVQISPRLNPPPVTTTLGVRWTDKVSSLFTNGGQGAVGTQREYKYFLIKLGPSVAGTLPQIGVYLEGAEPTYRITMDVTDRVNTINGTHANFYVLPANWRSSFHTWAVTATGMGSANATFVLYFDGAPVITLNGPFLPTAGNIGGPGELVVLELGSNINNGPDVAQSRWWGDFGVYLTRPSLVP